MLRDIFSNKGVLAGLLFCIIIVAGSLLYSWHVERGIKEKEARTQRFLQQLETPKNARITPQTKGIDIDTVEPMVAPVATDNSHETMSEETDAESIDTADVFLPDDTVSEEEPADVPVLPFGFGPYPELPPEWEGAFPPVSVKHELMVRVAVKLREQGVDVEGTPMEDGLVYPVIKGIRYIEWAETGEGVKYIARSSGHPADGRRIRAIRDARGDDFTEADIPSDIKQVSYSEGIDPYEFLGLQR